MLLKKPFYYLKFEFLLNEMELMRQNTTNKAFKTNNTVSYN